MSDAPERIYATINGRRTRIILGGETGGYLPALIGGWCERPDEAGEVEYVRADLFDALKAENERLRKELGWAKADIAMAASIMRSR